MSKIRKLSRDPTLLQKEETQDPDAPYTRVLANDFNGLKSAEIPSLLRGFKSELMAFGAIVFRWAVLKMA